MWLDSESGSLLGEDSWPAEVSFKIPDIVRLFESQILDYDEGLFGMYMELLMQNENSRIHEERDDEPLERFNQMVFLLGHMCELSL